jgi:hypothetical protein
MYIILTTTVLPYYHATCRSLCALPCRHLRLPYLLARHCGQQVEPSAVLCGEYGGGDKTHVAIVTYCVPVLYCARLFTMPYAIQLYSVCCIQCYLFMMLYIDTLLLFTMLYTMLLFIRDAVCTPYCSYSPCCTPYCSYSPCCTPYCSYSPCCTQYCSYNHVVQYCSYSPCCTPASSGRAHASGIGTASAVREYVGCALAAT